MEAIADAGEIGISPALARSARPAAASGRAEGRRSLLGGAARGRARARAGDVGDVSALDIASCIPVAARAHVLLQKSEPEHRTITAAFIDMMDTDRLLAELGPEGARRRPRRADRADPGGGAPVRGAVLRDRRRQVERQGAADRRRPVEHRPRRGADAPRRCARSWISPASCRCAIGVNTGKVFTGDFGPPYRRAYRVFGDAINTAARVMSKAEAGQILSTEIVLNRSRTIFEATPIPPFAAKGKSEPVRASIVGPAIGIKRGAPRSASPLVGREAELATILDAGRTGARPGRLRSSRSPASPGVGKTRLIEEVIARVARLPGPAVALRGVRGVDAVLRDARDHPRDRRARVGRGCRDRAIAAALAASRQRRRSGARPVDPAARASCSASTCRTRPRPRPSTSGSCASAWPRSTSTFLQLALVSAPDDPRRSRTPTTSTRRRRDLLGRLVRAEADAAGRRLVIITRQCRRADRRRPPPRPTA